MRYKQGGSRASPVKITVSQPHGLPGPPDSAGRLTRSHSTAGAIDREHLLNRLAHFRTILPAFAQEVASARRQSAALRVENRKLLEEIRLLRRQRGESSPSSTTSGKTSAEAPAERSTMLRVPDSGQPGFAGTPKPTIKGTPKPIKGTPKPIEETP